MSFCIVNQLRHRADGTQNTATSPMLQRCLQLKSMTDLKLIVLFALFATNAYSNSNVLITGKFASNPFKEIPLTRLGLSYNAKDVSEITATVDDSGHFQFSFFANEAGFYRLGDGWFGHIIFIEPDDTVAITLIPYPPKEIKSGTPLHRSFNKMIVHSKKAKHYSFFDQLYQTAKLPIKYQLGKEPVVQYKKRCDTAYAISNRLLKKYLDSKQVSDSFAYYAKAEIDAEYILNLCDCLYWIPKTTLPVNFFDNVPLHDFNDENIASKIDSYITAVSVYNVYIANNFDTRTQGYTNFEGEFDWAFKNLTGLIRDRIMAWIIDDYKDRDFPSYDSVYNVFLSNCQTAKLRNWAVNQVEHYKRENKAQTISFDEVLMKTKVVNRKGDTLSFVSILGKETNSIIDFWATWCKPCLAEKPSFEKAAEKYHDRLTFLSISADEDFEAWQKFPKKSHSVNEYFLIENFNSPIALYLKLETIPRFVSINRKQSKVVDRNLTRPQLESQFDTILDSYTN